MGFLLPHRSRRVFSILKFSKLLPFSDFFEASPRKKIIFWKFFNIIANSQEIRESKRFWYFPYTLSAEIPKEFIQNDDFWTTIIMNNCKKNCTKYIFLFSIAPKSLIFFEANSTDFCNRLRRCKSMQILPSLENAVKRVFWLLFS